MKDSPVNEELSLRCPECGKSLVVSLQSLVLSGGVVVCPRCLHQYVPEGIELPEVPVEPDATAAISDSDTDFVFCHACGKRLPADHLNFCPYCGTKLHFDSDGGYAVQPSATEERQHIDERRGEERRTDNRRAESKRADKTPVKRQPKMLTPLPFNTFAQASRRDLLPSTKFKVVAWFIIITLLTLAAYLTYAISTLNNNLTITQL